MLELESIASLFVVSPSGVPFIEMLEYKAQSKHDGYCPSGVPFIEMLE